MRKIYKALIVGSGAAAYSAADWLYKDGIAEIAMLSENRISGTSRNTGSDKQTYYKISMDGETSDSAYKMAKDMFSTGSCDGVKMYLEAVNSQRCFLRLYDYGVEFPTDSFGGFPGYKTDHDNTKRATSVGPLTSKVMTEKLENVVINKNKTPFFDNRQVIKILLSGKRAVGVLALNLETSETEAFFAENIICATGAPACVYEDSVYPESQHGMTGILIEAGVKMCNLTQWQYGMASVDFRWNVSGSFMQVIPRFVSADENGNESEFLKDYISDIHKAYSLVFLKGYQWPFSFARANESSMIDIAVHSEMKKGRKVYLDYTRNPECFEFESLSEEAKEYITHTACNAETPIERLKKLNSKAIDVYLRQGIDLEKQKLRIAVCAQHNNGGAYTDENFESNIKGLYVIGEAAGTFGLARPGGSALNDTQVGGLVASRHIKAKKTEPLNEEELSSLSLNSDEAFETDNNTDYSYFKKQMSLVASFNRDYEGCQSLYKEVCALLDSLPFRHKTLSDYYKDKDMLLSIKALLYAIITECEQTGSRGGAIFTKDKKVISENLYYRDYITVTFDDEIQFIKVSAVPTLGEPFEKYLSKISESKFKEN